MVVSCAPIHPFAMVTDNVDTEKPAVRAEALDTAEVDARNESGGLPGRPMVLLIAIGLALMSALIAWLLTGGAAALFGR
jgi:hypothetical protein